MSEEMRKEFEGWYLQYCEKNNYTPHLERRMDDEYFYSSSNNLWTGWQASREAMRPIKLPVVNLKMPMDYRIGFSRAVYDCEDAIQQAGYKVEE